MEDTRRLAARSRQSFVNQLRHHKLVKFEEFSSDNDSIYSEEIYDSCSQSETTQKKRPRSVDSALLQRQIKSKIATKIGDLSNKVLYPELMGPHQIYTVESAMKGKAAQGIVDLKVKLREWMAKLLNITDLNLGDPDGNLDGRPKERRGKKYNKYTLGFKIELVNKIRQEIASKGPNAKSLRHYIVKQASKLKIHPKNITRWFETKDLDKKQGGRKAKFPILEYRLASFMKEHPDCKRKSVLEEARRIFSETGEAQNFNFSKGWYERFKIRLRENKIEKTVAGLIDNEHIMERFIHSKSLAEFLAKDKPNLEEEIDGKQCKIEADQQQEKFQSDRAPKVKLEHQH